MPIVPALNSGHCWEDDSKDVSKDKIKEDNFDKWPVLFIVESFNKDGF